MYTDLFYIHIFTLLTYIYFIDILAMQHVGSQFSSQVSKPTSPTLEAQSFKHWIAREVCRSIFLDIDLSFSKFAKSICHIEYFMCRLLF